MFKHIKSRYKEGKFSHRVAVLTGGTVLGQALVVLSSPILTRLYSPEDFGLLAVYSATIGMVSVVASLQYELAIPLPADDKRALNLLGLSFGIVILLSTLSTAFYLFFGDLFIGWFKVPKLKPFLWLIPLSLFFVGAYQALNFWAIRKKAFTTIAKTKLTQSIGQTATQVGFGLIYSGPLGLLLGQLLGQATGIGLLAKLLKQNNDYKSELANFSGAMRVAKEYRRFPIYASLSSVLSNMSTHVPIFFLSYYFGSGVTGLYALGIRVLHLPGSLVGRSISQVFFSAAADSNLSGTVDSVTDNVFRNLFTLGLPFFVLLGIVAPELFSFIFGPSWKTAGIFVQILMPWIFLDFIITPLSMLISVLQRQATELQFQIIYPALMIASLSFGGMLENPKLSIFLFSVSGSVFFLGKILWILSISGNSIYYSLIFILKELIAIFPLAAPLIIIKLLTTSDLLVLVGGLLAFIIVSAKMYYRFRAITAT